MAINSRGTVRIVACIEDSDVIEKILSYLVPIRPESWFEVTASALAIFPPSACWILLIVPSR